MTNTRPVKRALLSSVLALCLCFAMLLGTTYAWFTDSAVSSNNMIAAGTLDVELWHHTASGSTNITTATDPLFSETVKWEPNKTQVAYLSIKNNGTLDLKYKVAVVVTAITDHDLTEVMYYAITPDAKVDTNPVTAWVGDENAAAKKLNPGVGITETDAQDVTLLQGEEHFFALSIHMDDEAANKYMGDSITFDIKVLAGQLASEEDSFGKDYDAFAGYPGAGEAAVNQNGATEVPVVDDNGDKVGSVVIPQAAVAAGTQKVVAKISKSNYEGNFTVDAGMESIAYEVTVEGLVDGNTTPVKTALRIAAGLDPDTVKLYHYDTEIDCTYNPYTGYVTFETATFSPFTVVFDAESEFVPVLPEGSTYPVAKVTYEEQYVNAELPWGDYGAWAPTAGLDANLEAAFTFACPDYENATDEEKAIIDAYRYWYCDFFVMLDCDLGANEIFLGGNYGSFGWVGFHNGDLTLDAGTAIPLLSSVTTNPWTYGNVEFSVGEFICGVGDVADALDGQTFTVMLRLINPDTVDTTVAEWWNAPGVEYIDVNVVTYTFGGDYNIQ